MLFPSDLQGIDLYKKNEWSSLEEAKWKVKTAMALWKMKAARDGGEDFCDPEREDNILGRNKTRLELWEEHLKDPIVALDKALK